MIGHIYKITNLLNGKIYIGQTISKNPRTRMKKHFCMSFGRNHHALHRAIRKYGKDNFLSEILCAARNQEDLDYLEIYYIEYFNSLTPSGYNIEAGGKSGSPISDLRKKKISEKVKEYYKNNVHPFKGKKFSKEHVENLSKVRKGFYSEARSFALKKTQEKARIKVKAINIETKQELFFDSISEASKKLNLDSGGVSRVATGQRRQVGGWIIVKLVDNS